MISAILRKSQYKFHIVSPYTVYMPQAYFMKCSSLKDCIDAVYSLSPVKASSCGNF